MAHYRISLDQESGERLLKLACPEEINEGELTDHQADDRQKYLSTAMLNSDYTAKAVKAEHFHFLQVCAENAKTVAVDFLDIDAF